jgi:hypothetical protein
MTSLAGLVIGHTFNSPFVNTNESVLSFSKKFLIHYYNYVLNVDNYFTLCKGTNTLPKNSLCSLLSGVVKPEITDDNISSNSVSPL